MFENHVLAVHSRDEDRLYRDYTAESICDKNATLRIFHSDDDRYSFTIIHSWENDERDGYDGAIIDIIMPNKLEEVCTNHHSGAVVTENDINNQRRSILYLIARLSEDEQCKDKEGLHSYIRKVLQSTPSTG